MYNIPLNLLRAISNDSPAFLCRMSVKNPDADSVYKELILDEFIGFDPCFIKYDPEKTPPFPECNTSYPHSDCTDTLHIFSIAPIVTNVFSNPDDPVYQLAEPFIDIADTVYKPKNYTMCTISRHLVGASGNVIRDSENCEYPSIFKDAGNHTFKPMSSIADIDANLIDYMQHCAKQAPREDCNLFLHITNCVIETHWVLDKDDSSLSSDDPTLIIFFGQAIAPFSAYDMDNAPLSFCASYASSLPD